MFSCEPTQCACSDSLAKSFAASDYPFSGKINPQRERKRERERGSASGYNYSVQSESNESRHRKSFETRQKSVFDKSEQDAEWDIYADKSKHKQTATTTAAAAAALKVSVDLTGSLNKKTIRKIYYKTDCRACCGRDNATARLVCGTIR